MVTECVLSLSHQLLCGYCLPSILVPPVVPGCSLIPPQPHHAPQHASKLMVTLYKTILLSAIPASVHLPSVSPLKVISATAAGLQGGAEGGSYPPSLTFNPCSSHF